jgi:6-phosphofructo-2-kinase/fructose-2,6-biphosphatase 4
VPGSPEDIRMFVSAPGSSSFENLSVAALAAGNGGESNEPLSPIPGLSSPAELNLPSVAVERPPEKVINTAKQMVADKVDDED